MRVLVCGGRTYGCNVSGYQDEDYDACEEQALKEEQNIYTALYDLNKDVRITEVIHGGAEGADSYAGVWARACRVKETEVKANWRQHGKSAGFIRNREMARMKPDLVVAFPGGKGTANMVAIAKEMGLPVRCYE